MVVLRLGGASVNGAVVAHHFGTDLGALGHSTACLINVPFSKSSNASLSSSRVFMTIGPYQAIGSPIGLPDTRRKRRPAKTSRS